MKKLTRIAGMASLAFLLVSCQNSENGAAGQGDEQVDENSQDAAVTEDTDEMATEGTSDEDTTEQEDMEEESTNEGDDSSNEDGEASNTGGDDNSDTYAGAQITPNYFIGSHPYDTGTDFLTAYTITREEEENLSPEERLKRSLIENDPSEQEILGSFTEISVEWPKLQVHFTEEGNQLSTTSAQTTLFYDSLVGISDFYGIEEITFTNPDGEEDIIVAQSPIDKPIIIKDERGLSRGYYTIYDKDTEQTLFLSGGDLEEQVENENGEPLSFPETVEAMGTVKNEDTFYSSAIVEGLEVVSASLENGNATVQYTMDEETITEADRTVFENAMQLAALDFNAWEIRLVNDTAQEIRTYPLVGQ
ncbi:hypothetical protein FZC84_21535 [Rossellomorea vietnamensis]|uniref:GerMN domain-containing protein n=1 Tax=Rossellomorea vietnamensis TaxID=218284 RepID=A0A5D4M1X0_9BACI|nr:hypothetical protein [Rossellomorea vietnamensis]TYR95541.1 hypothetical protein FZC84_21535 [Rossellomorea vietnamensis]